MTDFDRITVTNIKTILYVKKNKAPGHIDVYTVAEGSATYELIYRLSGKTVSNVDGTVFHTAPGNLQYLPKGIAKIKYEVETVEIGECIDIFFDTDIPLTPEPFCIDSIYTSDFSDLFQTISQIWTIKEPGYYQEAMSVLYKILSLLLKSSTESSHYRKIKPGIDFLNEQYCLYDIHPHQASKLCNMSYSYFRRLFVHCMGTSPGKYIIGKKIVRAKELLSSGQYNVTETAEAVGFSDIYYFSHVFKKHTGQMPSEFSPKSK